MSLRVVVIGTGFGKYAMTPVFESLGCEVELVSARDSAAVVRAVTGPCDLVSIHSAPFQHLEHVQLAVENGRHVLCDKPFGRNPAEAGTMLEFARSSGVLHFLNFEFRCDPLRVKMKELLESGAIGTPRHMACNMYISRGRTLPHGWLFEKDKGGGWIGAFASHQVDALRWFFGEVEQVSCITRIDVESRPERHGADRRMTAASAEDALTAWLQMENGVTAVIDTAFSSAVDLPSQISLFGSEGVLQLHENVELVLLRPGRESEHFRGDGANEPLRPALQRWLGRVCEAVTGGHQIAPDFTAGLACARVLDAMRAGPVPPRL